eukprot:PhM_4_TR5442/c0_g1_i1/m.67984
MNVRETSLQELAPQTHLTHALLDAGAAAEVRDVLAVAVLREAQSRHRQGTLDGPAATGHGDEHVRELAGGAARCPGGHRHRRRKMVRAGHVRGRARRGLDVAEVPNAVLDIETRFGRHLHSPWDVISAAQKPRGFSVHAGAVVEVPDVLATTAAVQEHSRGGCGDSAAARDGARGQRLSLLRPELHRHALQRVCGTDTHVELHLELMRVPTALDNDATGECDGAPGERRSPLLRTVARHRADVLNPVVQERRCVVARRDKAKHELLEVRALGDGRLAHDAHGVQLVDLHDHLLGLVLRALFHLETAQGRRRQTRPEHNLPIAGSAGGLALLLGRCLALVDVLVLVELDDEVGLQRDDLALVQAVCNGSRHSEKCTEEQKLLNFTHFGCSLIFCSQ